MVDVTNSEHCMRFVVVVFTCGIYWTYYYAVWRLRKFFEHGA